jgi:tetratricopeptide (TPR) repeat protein
VINLACTVRSRAPKPGLLLALCLVIGSGIGPIKASAGDDSKAHDVDISIDGITIKDLVLLQPTTEPRVAEVNIRPSDAVITDVIVRLNGDISVHSTDEGSDYKPIRLRFPVPLRPYGNELSVTIHYKNKDRLQRIIHPYLSQDDAISTRQTAILIRGAGTANANSRDQLASRLKGVENGKVLELGWPSSSDSDLIASIYGAAQEMKPGDRLIVYYSGSIIGPSVQSACLLQDSASTPKGEYSCLTIGSLVRLLSKLRVARVSVILDISRLEEASDKLTRFIPLTDGSEQIGVASSDDNSWTQSINGHPHFELIVSASNDTHIIQQPLDTTPFTGQFLKWWDYNANAAERDGCKSAASLMRYLRGGASGTQSTGVPMVDVPLYLSTVQDRDSSCFNFASLPKIALQVLKNIDGKADFAAATTVSLDSAELIVSVNGVAVGLQHPIVKDEGGLIHFSTYLGPGLNWVTVMAKTAATTIAQGELLAPGKAEAAVIFERSGDKEASHITLEQPVGTGVTGRDNIFVTANIHNHGGKEGVYTVSNNGTLIYQGGSHVTHLTDSFQRTVQVPLQVGANLISLRFASHASDALREITVTRSPVQPVLALLVGANIDAPSGPMAIEDAAKDVEIMRRILLKYTDAAPDDTVILTGQDATKANVEKSLRALSGKTGPAGPIPGTVLNSSQVTLIVYYSGYGASVPVSRISDLGSSDEMTRCLAMYGNTIDDVQSTCLPLTRLLSLAASGAWDRSLVILDTSFNGAFGRSQLSVGTIGEVQDYLSKTVPSIRRGTIGDLQQSNMANNQTILYASGPSQAAMESIQREQGLFTFGLDAALKQLTSGEGVQTSAVTLVNVLDFANSVLRSAHQDQSAYGEGDLTSPQLFKDVNLAVLQREWMTSFNKMARDLYSMRARDDGAFEYASRAVSKAEQLTPDDPIVQVGRALALRYEALQCATPSCPQLLEAEQLLNTAEKALLQDHRESTKKLTLYNAYATRAMIHMMLGQPEVALKDAFSAEDTKMVPLRASFLLAEVNLALGHLQDAAKYLDDVMEFGNEHGADAEVFLSPSDWGRAVVWRSMLLYGEGKRGQASSLLEAYTRRDTFEYLALIRPLARISGRKHINPEAEGIVGSDDAWMGLIANLLLGKRKPQEIMDYSKTVDRLNTVVFTCQSQLYLAYQEMLTSGYSEEVTSKLTASVATGQTELGEYWLAKMILQRQKISGL